MIWSVGFASPHMSLVHLSTYAIPLQCSYHRENDPMSGGVTVSMDMVEEAPGVGGSHVVYIPSITPLELKRESLLLDGLLGRYYDFQLLGWWDHPLLPEIRSRLWRISASTLFRMVATDHNTERLHHEGDHDNLSKCIINDDRNGFDHGGDRMNRDSVLEGYEYKPTLEVLEAVVAGGYKLRCDRDRDRDASETWQRLLYFHTACTRLLKLSATLNIRSVLTKESGNKLGKNTGIMSGSWHGLEGHTLVSQRTSPVITLLNQSFVPGHPLSGPSVLSAECNFIAGVEEKARTQWTGADVEPLRVFQRAYATLCQINALYVDLQHEYAYVRFVSLMLRIVKQGSEASNMGFIKADNDQVDGDGQEIYCWCRRVENNHLKMICCDKCEEWFHIACICEPNVKKTVEKSKEFICIACSELASKKYMYIWSRKFAS